MKCEICGDNEAQKEPERDTITGVEWYMCENCRRFFSQMEKEMPQFEDVFDFSKEEMEEDD